MVKIKRVYAEPDPGDGRRILVDRLWPRGVAKARAGVDWWLKEIAPSDELRRWFGHDSARWPEFQSRYRQELEAQVPLLNELRGMAARETITLLFAAKDEEHNNAVLLKELLAR